MSSHFEIVASRSELESRRAKEPEVNYYWRLKAPNGEIVATSEMYTRPEDVERAIDALIVAVDEAYDQESGQDYEHVGW